VKRNQRSSDSSRERFSGWDIIPTQVPYSCSVVEEKKPVPNGDDSQKRDRLAQLHEIIFKG
jgi:hypothetical protein